MIMLDIVSIAVSFFGYPSLSLALSLSLSPRPPSLHNFLQLTEYEQIQKQFNLITSKICAIYAPQKLFKNLHIRHFLLFCRISSQSSLF
jgi:hypothetical protein